MATMAPPMLPGYSLRVQLFAPNAYAKEDKPIRCFRVVTSPEVTVRDFCQEASRIHEINYGQPIAIKKVQDDLQFDITQTEVLGHLFMNMSMIRVIQASPNSTIRDSVPPTSALRWDPSASRKRDREIAQPNGSMPSSSWNASKRQKINDRDSDLPLPSSEPVMNGSQPDHNSPRPNSQGSLILRNPNWNFGGSGDVRDSSPRVSATPSPPPENGVANHLRQKSAFENIDEEEEPASPHLQEEQFEGLSHPAIPTAIPTQGKGDRRRSSGSTTSPFLNTAPKANGNGAMHTPKQNGSAKRSRNEESTYDNITSDEEDGSARRSRGKLRINPSPRSGGLPGHEWVKNRVTTPSNGSRHSSRDKTTTPGELPLTPSSKERQRQAQEVDETRKAAAAAAEQRKQEADEARAAEETQLEEEKRERDRAAIEAGKRTLAARAEKNAQELKAAQLAKEDDVEAGRMSFRQQVAQAAIEKKRLKDLAWKKNSNSPSPPEAAAQGTPKAAAPATPRPSAPILPNRTPGSRSTTAFVPSGRPKSALKSSRLSSDSLVDSPAPGVSDPIQPPHSLKRMVSFDIDQEPPKSTPIRPPTKRISSNNLNPNSDPSSSQTTPRPVPKTIIPSSQSSSLTASIEVVVPSNRTAILPPAETSANRSQSRNTTPAAKKQPACTACNKAKRKCDREKPSCGGCVKRSVRCRYPDQQATGKSISPAEEAPRASTAEKTSTPKPVTSQKVSTPNDEASRLGKVSGSKAKTPILPPKRVTRPSLPAASTSTPILPASKFAPRKSLPASIVPQSTPKATTRPEKRPSFPKKPSPELEISSDDSEEDIPAVVSQKNKLKSSSPRQLQVHKAVSESEASDDEDIPAVVSQKNKLKSSSPRLIQAQKAVSESEASDNEDEDVTMADAVVDEDETQSHNTSPRESRSPPVHQFAEHSQLAPHPREASPESESSADENQLPPLRYDPDSGSEYEEETPKATKRKTRSKSGSQGKESTPKQGDGKAIRLSQGSAKDEVEQEIPETAITNDDLENEEDMDTETKDTKEINAESEDQDEEVKPKSDMDLDEIPADENKENEEDQDPPSSPPILQRSSTKSKSNSAAIHPKPRENENTSKDTLSAPSSASSRGSANTQDEIDQQLTSSLVEGSVIRPSLAVSSSLVYPASSSFTPVNGPQAAKNEKAKRPKITYGSSLTRLNAIKPAYSSQSPGIGGGGGGAAAVARRSKLVDDEAEEDEESESESSSSDSDSSSDEEGNPTSKKQIFSTPPSHPKSFQQAQKPTPTKPGSALDSSSDDSSSDEEDDEKESSDEDVEDEETKMRNELAAQIAGMSDDRPSSSLRGVISPKVFREVGGNGNRGGDRGGNRGGGSEKKRKEKWKGKGKDKFLTGYAFSQPR